MLDIELPDDDDRVECAECGEWIPRMHTAMRSGVGRVCWFCHSDEDEDDDDDYEDSYSAWDYDY